MQDYSAGVVNGGLSLGLSSVLGVALCAWLPCFMISRCFMTSNLNYVVQFHIIRLRADKEKTFGGAKNMFLRGLGGVEFTWRTFFGLIWVESTHIFKKNCPFGPYHRRHTLFLTLKHKKTPKIPFNLPQSPMSCLVAYLSNMEHATLITDGRRRRSELARLWPPRVASSGFRKKSGLDGNGGTRPHCAQ